MKMQFINAREQKIEKREFKNYDQLCDLVEGTGEHVFLKKDLVLLINSVGLFEDKLSYGFSIVNEKGQGYQFIGNGCLCQLKEGKFTSLEKGLLPENITWLDEDQVKQMQNAYSGPTILSGKDVDTYLNLRSTNDKLASALEECIRESRDITVKILYAKVCDKKIKTSSVRSFLNSMVESGVLKIKSKGHGSVPSVYQVI